MHSMGLSQAGWQRLNELCDEWAVWFTRRWGDRPSIEVPSINSWALKTGRQHQEMHEVSAAMMRGMGERVDMAINSMGVEHPVDRRVLHRWAWVNHYNRKVIRTVEKTETGTRVTHKPIEDAAFTTGAGEAPRAGPALILVNEDTLTAAQTKLVPWLLVHHLVLE